MEPPHPWPASFHRGLSSPGQDGDGRVEKHANPGAFVAKVGKKARPSIYKRSGRGRFPLIEQTMPIKDIADPIIEDEVFPEATRIFLKNLMHELKYRARLRAEGIGG
ncbi:hypothetical protein [Paracoccus simplex]|uniref:Uncharacterized protein n=1 Tax=Paracoccus simplex TaxID=2086346 RepID=A0ABV7S3T0_9RHOB